MNWLSSHYQWIVTVVAMPIILLLLKRWADSSKKKTDAAPRPAHPIFQNVNAPVFNVNVAPTTTRANAEPARPWPNQKGEYPAASSEDIPPFPNTLSGFRSEEGMDFWGKPFPIRGTVRVFQGRGWLGIPKFPSTMNGCSHGFFMVRWRSDTPDEPVQSSVRFSAAVGGESIKTGSFGYMSGTNCEQPMFNFGDTPNRKGGTLTNVHYELKFWRAAP